MKFKYFTLILFITVEINCQSAKSDSSQVQIVNLKTKSDSVAVNNDSVIKRSKDNNKLLPDDLFMFRPGQLHLNNFGINNLPSEPVPLAASVEYSFSEYNKEFAKYLNNIYIQSKPTALQEILGIVDFAGALFLAGYHIYKYDIKKDKK